MMQSTIQKRIVSRRRAFTFIEVVAAIGLLSLMIATVLVLMNRFVSAVTDMRLRQEAFELARSHMETLLSESRLPDIYDSGESEINPAIEWETIVEPFHEPYKGRMWIRAICSASYIDSDDQEQKIEMEHWITNLTAAQIKQIVDQQKTEDAYMDLLQEGQYSDIQKTTIAFLTQEGMDVKAYKDLLEEQRRKKLLFLNKTGVDGYDAYVEQLAAEENKFLEDQGMDFDLYNAFAENYTPPDTQDDTTYDDGTATDNSYDSGTSGETGTNDGTGGQQPDAQPDNTIPNLDKLPPAARELLGL